MDRIDALRLLIDVAELGSFSSVARQRAIATSTVTLAVGQLEQELGARLLARSTRRLSFTHEGQRLLADARRIVSEWDAAFCSLRQDGALNGPIRITATNDFGRTRLRPLLDAFQARHPELRISLLLSDNTVDLIEEHIDLALRSGPLPDSSLHARLLVRGARLVCAAPGYWARHGRPAHPDTLAGHNCLVLARPGAPIAAWPFRADDRLFHVKVSGDRQASDGEVVREWAVLGLGVALKNHWDIAQDLASGALETALDAFVAGPVDLYAVHPGGPPSRRVAALVDFLAQALGGPQPPAAVTAASPPP
ncbi:LysR family transcriptional regulator [Pseudorhodoferax sp. Leaf265]|uniref:LysR family transcriptional regulator n=1 Tax=Pseudorhodoferax sp. Leaf265 TaxID=1736315 RepID=UPI000702260C|nr:LysR family transcriptional regulator [Pseudorhodoferax sp. Leaf265]KQP19478.1 LysR family transcriptional regulator [Pseudorhodoferax sp. Leaf265]